MESCAALATIRVFVIESNELDARQITDLLGEAVNYQFAAEHSTDPDEAMAKIESRRPDVVLLGLNIIDTAGIAAIDRLCKLDSTVPVVVAVGHADEVPSLEALRIGAQDVLGKIDLSGLALRRALRFAIARKAEERLLRLMRQQAEDASRAKSDYLASLSHELRTPLNAIMGFSEIIKSEMHGPVGVASYREYAQDIHDSGRYLLSMMNGLLDLSKIEAGRVTLSESVVDIRGVIANASHLLQEAARQRGVRLLLEVSPLLKPLRADREKLQQILINLVSNAIKFTPARGSVTIGAAHDSEGRLVLTVVDTGIGIAVEDINRVLRPFGQVEDPAGRNKEGAGLGLPLTDSLVRLHGGSLQVGSAPGEGTSVTVLFPADRVVGAEADPDVIGLNRQG